MVSSQASLIGEIWSRIRGPNAQAMRAWVGFAVAVLAALAVAILERSSCGPSRGKIYAILGRAMTIPKSILSRDLLPASVAIFTTVAIVAFEGLAVTAALPDLTAELGQVHLLPWVITAFLLASGVTTAIAGSFIDSVGTSRVFRWATFAFAASSLAAAAESSMPMLVATRVFQGAAGGAIISVGVGAVALVYPSHLVGRAFAANSNVWGILGFAGPASTRRSCCRSGPGGGSSC